MYREAWLPVNGEGTSRARHTSPYSGYAPSLTHGGRYRTIVFHREVCRARRLVHRKPDGVRLPMVQGIGRGLPNHAYEEPRHFIVGRKRSRDAEPDTHQLEGGDDGSERGLGIIRLMDAQIVQDAHQQRLKRRHRSSSR